MEMEVIRQTGIEQQFASVNSSFSEQTQIEKRSSSLSEVWDNWTSPNRIKSNKRSRRKGSGGTRHTRVLFTSGTNSRQRPYPEMTQSEARKLRRRVQDDFDRPRAPYNTTQFLMDYHENASDQDADAETSLTDCPLKSPTLPATRVRSRTMSESMASQAKKSPTLSLQLLVEGSAGPSDDSSIESESSPGVYSASKGDSLSVTPNFEEVDFSKTYNTIHIESLFGMSKQDLVKEVLSLEKRIEHLETRVEILATSPISSGKFLKSLDTNSVSDARQSKDKVQIDRAFVRCLQQEICDLQKANRKLQMQS